MNEEEFKEHLKLLGIDTSMCPVFTGDCDCDIVERNIVVWRCSDYERCHDDNLIEELKKNG